MVEHCRKDEYLNSFCRTRLKLLNQRLSSSEQIIMIDISHLRQEVTELKTAIGRKKVECDLDSIVELDRNRRDCIASAEKARGGQKAANDEMSKLQKGSPEFLEKVAQMKEVAAEVKELEAVAKQADDRFQNAFLSIPKHD